MLATVCATGAQPQPRLGPGLGLLEVEVNIGPEPEIECAESGEAKLAAACRVRVGLVCELAALAALQAAIARGGHPTLSLAATGCHSSGNYTVVLLSLLPFWGSQ